MNRSKNSFFTHNDHDLILKAIDDTKDYLRELVLMMVTTGIEKRKVS